MKSFILMSSPRHGTNYFCRILNHESNLNNFTMCYELLSNHFETITAVWRNFKIHFADHGIKISNEEISHLINLRKTNLRLYLESALEYNKRLAEIRKNKWNGYKLFSGHLKYNYEDPLYEITVKDVISKADSVIYLNRCNLEFIFSYLQARATNMFGILQRDKKLDISEIEQKFEYGYSSMEWETHNLLKMKQETYLNLIKTCKEESKDLLCLNYNDFATTGWSKVSSFLDTPINLTNFLFNKNAYDYDNFYTKYPKLKDLAQSFAVDV